MNLVLAAEACPPENPNCFHVPTLSELFEFAPMFGDGTLFAFNRVTLLYVLAAVIVCWLFVAAFRKPSLVPDKLQGVIEAIVGFIRDEIALQVMGPPGLRFVPFLTALFMFIFVNNFYEIMPFVQLPSTGRMALPAFLALTVYTVFVVVGIKHQGLRYFKNVAFPSGVPAFVLPLVVPIEIVSTFVVRPLTLAVRLFANMMAGHILLAIIFIAANAFFIGFHGEFAINLKAWPIGIAALAFGPAMVAFELMVAALQAYIFTILAAVYIGSSMEAEH